MGTPRSAERAEIVGSPADRSGTVMLPFTALFTKRRFMTPPAQRTPWPKVMPEGIRESPWSRMLGAFGLSSLVVKTRLSIERYAIPLAESTAPPVEEELSQPRVEPEGGLPQGQSITLFAPGSHRLVKPVEKRSWMNMSV